MAEIKGEVETVLRQSLLPPFFIGPFLEAALDIGTTLKGEVETVHKQSLLPPFFMSKF